MLAQPKTTEDQGR